VSHANQPLGIRARAPVAAPGFASRGRARIGVVVPASNTNLEPDLALLCPRGVTLHFARAGGYDLDAVPDAEQMRRFGLAGLDEVAATLAAARPHVVLYGCTSATLAHGADFDAGLAARLSARAGGPAVTAAGALVEALRALGARRIGFASPYVRALNALAAEYLRAAGFDVVEVAFVGAELDNYQQGAMTPSEVYALGRRADHPRAEAVVLSCTDLRAVEALDALESALAKPVVTSNQALMHAAKTRLGLGCEDAPPIGGRLLQGGSPPAKAGGAP